jgi:hypothetical protein
LLFTTINPRPENQSCRRRPPCLAAPSSGQKSKEAMSSGLDPGSDHSSLDLAIHRLLDQRTDIQARLASLVAAKHGFDPGRELDMLRTKLHVLEGLVDRHSTSSTSLFGSCLEFALLLCLSLHLFCLSTCSLDGLLCHLSTYYSTTFQAGPFWVRWMPWLHCHCLEDKGRKFYGTVCR